MNIGERVRLIRKSPGINKTLVEFGQSLGVSKSSISDIEVGRRVLTDQMALAICRTYGVNEEWLRTGAGEMFIQIDRSEKLARMVDELLADREESFRKRLVSAILSLNEDQLRAVESFCNKLYAAQDEQTTDQTDGIDIEEELAEYQRQLLAEKSQEASSSQSLA